MFVAKWMNKLDSLLITDDLFIFSFSGLKSFQIDATMHEQSMNTRD